MVMLIKGNGRFDFDIVGESHRQHHLRFMAGPEIPGGHDLECLAALILQDDNPYDDKAVAVHIVFASRKTLLVGYLARAEARRFRRCLDDVGQQDPEGMLCRAMIVGGRDNGDGKPGPYGVKLDLMMPLKLGTALSWVNWQKRLLPG